MSMNNRLTIGLREQQYQVKVNNGGCGKKSNVHVTLKTLKNW